MSNPVLAYHFTNGYALRDGQPLVVGKEYVFDGKPVMCDCGYHASRHVFDALQHAPGSVLSLVECRGVEDEDKEKLVCRSRAVIATIDATELLRAFARAEALRVVHLWDAPEIVVRYLKTGDEAIRDAARNAVRDAALSAARNAALSAARATDLASALDAARNATWSAALSAARDATIKLQRARLARMVNKAFKEARHE